jgi:hypothetical protein
MAGKVDSAAHAAAIAKISEAVKYEPELRAHLDEIIKGAAFKGSHRSQAFLKHIVEHALHADPADLRERSIGVALFGRPATYDTADDAIVRVTASDVRKRLLQHYGNTGHGSRFRISLPAGSYVPEFCFAPSYSPMPIESPSAATPGIAQIVVDSPAGPVPLPTVLSDHPPETTERLKRRTVATALCVLVVAAGAWFAFNRWLFPDTATENFFVAAFQSAPRSLQVVVADDALVLIQVLLDRRFTLDEYENLTYLSVPDLVRQKDLQRFWGSLSTRQITNVGDLQNANRIAAGLQARGWDVTVKQARQMHARSFRSGNFVILGSSLSNPWAALFPVNETNFPFDELPRPGKPEVILNRKPRNGEPPKFEVQVAPRTGRKTTFARVHLLENTARSGRILLVAGQSMSATEMAGEFLLRSGSAEQIRRMLGIGNNARMPDLEMVIRVSEQNEIGDNVDLAAIRKIGG